MEFSRPEVGSLSLLQEIFLIQGWNPGLPYCRWILYQLSHNKQKSQLNRIERPEWGALMTWEGSKASERRKTPLLSCQGLSPWKDTDCFLTVPSGLPFLPCKTVSLVQELACGLQWLQTSDCNSLLILNRFFFVGEITGSLCILSQHFSGLYGNQGIPLTALGLVRKKVWYPQFSSQSLMLSHKPWGLKVPLSPGSKFTSPLYLKFSRIYSRYF